MADLVAWVCRSPRRLVLVLGGTLLVVIVAGSTLFRGGGAQPAPSRPPTSAAASTGSGSVLAPDPTPFVTAAVSFVGQWSHQNAGESQAQWQARVDPLATPELAAALRQTDLANLPGGTPQGRPTVRFVADTSALIAVPLSTGDTVLVTVVNTGKGWQVSDVQPDEGDYGDTGGTQPAAP